MGKFDHDQQNHEEWFVFMDTARVSSEKERRACTAN